MRLLSVLIFVALCLAPAANGQYAPFTPKLVICGGGTLPDSVYQQFRQLAGADPSLVVIPTASQRAYVATEIETLWKSRGFPKVRVLHTTDRALASSAEFVAPLKTATAVWFGGGSQQRIADAYLDTLVEQEFYELIRRGGVIGGTSAGAAIQSRVMIASGATEPRLSIGLELLPNSIVDQHFLKRNRIPRLLAAVRSHPDLIGYGIDEGTALVTHDGKAKVVGSSYLLRVRSNHGKIEIDAFGDGDDVRNQDR